MVADPLDQIWLLAKIEREAFLAVKKEKTITICNLTLTPTSLRSFPLATTIDLLAEKSLIVAVQFSDRCEIWNLEQNRQVVPDLNLRKVKKITNTNRFVECQNGDDNHCLVDLESGATTPIQKSSSICFGDDNSVYGRASDRNPWVFNGRKFLSIKEDYLQEMENYSLVSLPMFAGIIRYGAAFRPVEGSVVVRYTFTVEDQTNYHITKDESSQTLWIDSIVGWKRADGGGFTLIKTEGQIQFLGVSQHIFRGEKGYFFIIETERKYLYISPYREFKEAIDDNRFEKPRGIEIDLPADCIAVHYLHGEFLKVNIAGKWYLYRESVPISSTSYDEIDHLNEDNFIKPLIAP